MTASQSHRLSRAADLALRIGAPLAVLAIVLAVFLGEEMRIDHELHLIAPEAARPGSAVPMRALVFDHLDMPDGPRVAPADVEVRVRDRDDRVRARARLARSAAGGEEGTIAIPRALRGWVTLEATASVEGREVASVRTALDVRADPPARPRLGRIANALQQLAVRSIEPGAIDPPSPFDVRVVGGACVPEERCDLVVHVGEPAAAVHVESAPSVTPEPSEATETSALVRLPIVVHGPEARVELVATRSGAEVARRSVQVPVALATPAIDVDARVVPLGAVPRLSAHVLGDRTGVAIEAYRDDQWVRTGSLSAGDARPLPFSLTDGVVRLEVHADPYTAEPSAVRVVVVRGRGESEARALERAVRSLGGAPEGEPALRLAWAAAVAEDSVHPLPDAISGRAEDDARLAARRERLRIAAIAALLVGIALAAVLFVRRGVDAALEAQRIMDETGDAELASRGHRRRTLLSALVLVATVLLAFLGAAALIVARAHLLG